MVETYGIIDYTALPVTVAARLAVGLRDDSRIKMMFGDTELDKKELLIASAVDVLNLLLWTKTTDAEIGLNRPKSIVERLSGKNDDAGEYMTFNSIEEFRKAYYG